MSKLLYFIALSLLASICAAMAEDTVLYCSEKHVVGLHLSKDKWAPAYANEDSGRRYAIRFNSDKSQMSGVQGTDTDYQCARYFPTKAPDVITCVNPGVATMVFNYSTESERFVFSLVGPGGWIGFGTEREEGRAPLGDSLVVGKCQKF